MFVNIKQRRDRKYRQLTTRHEQKARAELILNTSSFFYFSYTDFYICQLRQSRSKNICFWSGRCRGILKFGLSRHAIKHFGTRGLWLGLKKASW